MTTPEPELRATSDALLAALDRVVALESEKRSLMPQDPRFVEISHEVERLAAALLDEATVERELAEPAHVMAATNAPGAPTRPIDAISRPAYIILSEWRAAERALAEAVPGSAEARAASARASKLREEYAQAYADALESRTKP